MQFISPLSLSRSFRGQFFCVTAFAACGYGLQGCAAVESTPRTPMTPADGLVYYLPKRHVLVTVTVSATGTSLTITATNAVPDLKASFVATIPRNHIGTSDGSIGVNTVGLLDSDSTAKTTSQLSDTLSSITGFIGGARGYSLNERSAGCGTGTYSKVLRILDNGTFDPVDKPMIKDGGGLCDFSFELTRLLDTPPSSAVVDTPPTKAAYGFFYRQLIPYKVIASRVGDANPREFIVLSPTGSKTHFLPLSIAGFGNNTGGFSFDSGVPTKYSQKVESEFVGLVALPATLITAYFKAIGNAFNVRKESLTAESQYLASQNALELARQRRDACIAALATDDLATIKVACSP